MGTIFWLTLGLIILAGAMLFLRARKRVKETLGRPPGFRYKQPSLKDQKVFMEWWQGNYKGVEYTVEQLSDEYITVWMDAPHRIARALEVNPVKGKPVVQDSRYHHIQALLDLGVTYIDIGFNTNWVAAEFPVRIIKRDKELAVRAAEHLVEIRNLSQELPPKPPAYKPN